jgi:hypothetical protein
VKRVAAVLLAAILAAPGTAFDTSRPEGPGAGKDQLVCKREVPVGSLIASRKLCMTKEQWRKRADDGNATARGLIEDGAGACGQDGGVCPF